LKRVKFRSKRIVLEVSYGKKLLLRTPYITVPMHKELAKGTLRAIIRQAGLTVEEFLELL
jgi:hypothetical protein